LAADLADFACGFGCPFLIDILRAIYQLSGNDGKPPGNFTAASLLFCLAGATDLADGWIARNFKVGNIFSRLRRIWI
jgi:phosphatidylglycerophosphate synthase